MNASGDATTGPWTDPQTHLDTDPVNAAPAPGHEDDEDHADAEDTADAHAHDTATDGDAGPVEPS